MSSKQKAKKSRRKSGKGSESHTLRPEFSRTHLTEPQKMQITARFLSGESFRKIAEAEGRDIKTVMKVIRSAPIQEQIQDMKDGVTFLGQRAILNLHTALDPNGGNWTLALKVLAGLGLLVERDVQYYQQPSVRLDISSDGQARELTSSEKLALGLAQMITERDEAYGLPPISIESLKQKKAASAPVVPAKTS